MFAERRLLHVSVNGLSYLHTAEVSPMVKMLSVRICFQSFALHGIECVHSKKRNVVVTRGLFK